MDFLVEAKNVTLRSIEIKVDFGKDPDFVKYVKSKLIGFTLNQGKRIDIFILVRSIPFLVEKTEPEGDVTISENTVLQIVSDYIQIGEHKWVHKNSIQYIGEPSASLESFQLIIHTLKGHERRLKIITLKLENLIRKLKDVEKN